MTSNLSSAVISRDKQVKQDTNRLTDCQTKRVIGGIRDILALDLGTDEVNQMRMDCKLFLHFFSGLAAKENVVLRPRASN